MRGRAFAVVGMCAAVVSLVGAQAPKVATVKEVLYSAADSIGQLRLAAEVDRIATMTYTATGTLTVGNQPCKLKEYKASVNWVHKGMRVDYTCDGQPRRIEVVNHDIAWNETTPGVGATPVPAGAAGERQLMLWTMPAGVVKAATAAGAKRPSQSKVARPSCLSRSSMSPGPRFVPSTIGRATSWTASKHDSETSSPRSRTRSTGTGTARIT